MKIVVVGGSGLIGTKVVANLNAAGHEAVAASPKSGVNTLTGEGLAEVLKGARVIVDVSNSPSWEAAAVLDFFTKSTSNLLSFGAAAGVKHLVALSVVGSERLSDSGYFPAKVAQEKLIKESSIPYSIVRATQFFEFVKGICDSMLVGGEYRVTPMLIQPMASEDVASAVADVAMGAPLNSMVEVGGPEEFPMDELVRVSLRARGDARKVVTDAGARYFGALLGERTLVPDKGARLGKVKFGEWVGKN